MPRTLKGWIILIIAGAFLLWGATAGAHLGDLTRGGIHQVRDYGSHVRGMQDPGHLTGRSLTLAA